MPASALVGALTAVTAAEPLDALVALAEVPVVNASPGGRLPAVSVNTYEPVPPFPLTVCA